MMQNEKLPVVREDLYQFRFVSGAALSPDAQKVSYVINQADKETNSYHTAIWVKDLKTGSDKKIAAYGEAKSPLWLDENTLIFASGRDLEKGKAAKETKFYQISLTGGEASKKMTIPTKVEGIRLLGDGTYLVTASIEENPEVEEGEYEAKEGVDYDIYEELPFWFNGKGIRSRKRTALFIFKEEDESLTRITPKYMDLTASAVSADKKQVTFTGPIYDSIMERKFALYSYELETGETKKLTEDKEMHISEICYMGKKIFFTGTTFERVGKHPRFYLYDQETGIVTNLPFGDSSVGNTVGSDAKFGGGKSMMYDSEKGLLYWIRTLWGDSHLVAMDEEGNVTQLTKTPGAVTGFDMVNGTFVLTAMRGNALVELYAFCPECGEETKLTSHNDEYLESHDIQTPESFRYQSKNGYEMEGYILYPINYEPGKKYPAVLEIHGGPKGVDGSVFFHEFQCLASDGYFVFYGNPRGSDGRGEAYCDITEVFGKDDFQDLMEMTDVVLEKYQDIDASKVGICGGSYGGFMCNWMIGHTDRYAAAVSQRSISNYLTKCLYTDIGYYANRLQMGAYPWEDFDKVWEMSPLNGAAQAKTPTLWVQSDEDYRCWMGDAIQMYSAVKRQGTPGRMILFHGENHELSRSGKPENRMARLAELEAWFQKFL